MKKIAAKAATTNEEKIAAKIDNIEVAIRAAQIAKIVLGLLDDHGIHAARLRLAMAANQFAELNALLAKIDMRGDAKGRSGQE